MSTTSLHNNYSGCIISWKLTSSSQLELSVSYHNTIRHVWYCRDVLRVRESEMPRDVRIIEYLSFLYESESVPYLQREARIKLLRAL